MKVENAISYRIIRKKKCWNISQGTNTPEHPQHLFSYPPDHQQLSFHMFRKVWQHSNLCHCTPSLWEWENESRTFRHFLYSCHWCDVTVKILQPGWIFNQLWCTQCRVIVTTTSNLIWKSHSYGLISKLTPDANHLAWAPLEAQPEGLRIIPEIRTRGK